VSRRLVTSHAHTAIRRFVHPHAHAAFANTLLTCVEPVPLVRPRREGSLGRWQRLQRYEKVHMDPGLPCTAQLNDLTVGLVIHLLPQHEHQGSAQVSRAGENSIP